MLTTIQTTSTPDHDDLEYVGGRLSAFNDADVGPSEKQTLAVFLRDEGGAIIGGISGYTAWGWLYVQWLWIDANYRGQRLASRMLDAAEQEAVTRGCHGALIDTFSSTAAKTYERQGYKSFGVLPDFPIGRSRIYLQKTL